MNIPILYEDSDVVVVNKPSGLLVHGDGKSSEYTLADWVKEKYPDTEGVGEVLDIAGKDINRSGIVHRLDKDTSGVMVIVKTQYGFESLKEQFQNREVKKIYYAFVVGIPKESRGLINLPIGRSRTDIRQYSSDKTARGVKREAVTRYLVKESGHRHAFVQVFPETGRTHQIRVHFKAIRHPLVGDTLYGTEKTNIFGFTRTALHSYSLEFKNTKGSVVNVEAPMPDDFLSALNVLRK